MDSKEKEIIEEILKLLKALQDIRDKKEFYNKPEGLTELQWLEVLDYD
jgi:hypothetical protein